MTPEELIRLFGYPAVPFGGTPEPQPIPQPPAPVAQPAVMPQPAPVNMQTPPAIPAPTPTMQQLQGMPQGIDWKRLAQEQALKLLNQPEEKASPAMPLGMALMAMGQQMQTPRALRGRNDNLQSMANALLAWQIKNQAQQEQGNQRKIAAMSTLEKLYAPTKLGKDEKLLGQNYEVLAENPAPYTLGEGQERRVGNQVIAKGPEKQVNPHFTTGTDEQGNIIVTATNPRTLETSRISGNFGQKDYAPQYWVDRDNPNLGQWVKPGQYPSGGNFVPASVFGNLIKIPEMPEDVKNEFAKAWSLYGQKALPKTSGWMGGPLLADIQTRGIKYLKDAGMDVSNVLANQAEFSGLEGEMKQLMGQRGKILAFAKTADENLKQALELSQKVNRTGVPVINRWWLAGKKQIAGDPDVAAFHAANQVAINEFAKVTSSATGGGVTSDTARKEIENVLNTAQTPEQYIAVYNTLKRDMDNRVAGYEDRVSKIKGRFQEMGGVYKPEQSQGQGQNQQSNLQTSYQNALRRVQAMPEGPAKQTELQKLQQRAKELGL